MLKKILYILILSVSSFAQEFGDTEIPQGVYLGLGIGALQNLDADNPSYQAFIGKLWGLDESFAINSEFEVNTDFDKSYFLDGNLGLNYYPISIGLITPYIGAGGGLGWAKVGDNDALGFNLNGNLGVLLFRDLPWNLIIEGNLDWLLNDVVDDKPAVWSGKIGILF